MSRRTVTSAANPAVKEARALAERKAREETGLFLVEGLRSVIEALELARRPRRLFLAPQAGPPALVERARRGAEDVVEVSADLLARISRRENPQTVVGVYEQILTPLDQLSVTAAPLFVALEQVRDPGNLGAIVRTADAAGAGAVILVGDCCDPFSPQAVRATMGSIFAVPLVRASPEAFLAWRRDWPGPMVGAALQTDVSYRAYPYEKPTLLLMGAEQAGLSDPLRAACDALVKIPMRGRADSLNLAVATGVMIYAVLDRLEV